MIDKESKLTKYTLIACVLLLVAYFSTDARSDEFENIGAISAMCYVVTFHSDDPEQAMWWMQFSAAWLGNDVAAEAIAVAFEEINLDTKDTPVWLNGLAACKNMREEVESALDESEAM